MSLIKFDQDSWNNFPLLPQLMEHFDRADMETTMPNSGDGYIYIRVSKADMALVYEMDDLVDLELKRIDHTILPAGTNKCHIEIRSINGTSVMAGKNLGPKQEACINTDHRSQGSGNGVKSKG